MMESSRVARHSHRVINPRTENRNEGHARHAPRPCVTSLLMDCNNSSLPLLTCFSKRLPHGVGHRRKSECKFLAVFFYYQYVPFVFDLLAKVQANFVTFEAFGKKVNFRLFSSPPRSFILFSRRHYPIVSNLHAVVDDGDIRSQFWSQYTPQYS